ncbi:MAG TPA: hypothetical protein VEB66_00855 [Opitutaceae bacterium]|nr:hypothetical protein [Opitutaceae bacterium]
MNLQQPATALEQHAAPEKTHGGLGITSFIMGIVCGILMVVVIGIAGYMQMSTPGGMNEESPAAALVGLAMMGVGLLVLVGLGLGVAGLFQSDRKKLFAALGVSINLLIIVCTGGLMVIGMMAE